MPIMHDGLGTIIAFRDVPGIGGVLFKEQQIKPWGYDGRGPILTTSLRNQFVVTKLPKQLADVTDCSGTVQWDPALLETAYLQILQVNMQFDTTFPNGERWAAFGWLDKFDPQEHQEGELPLANITIVVSNVDPVTGAETRPLRLD